MQERLHPLNWISYVNENNVSFKDNVHLYILKKHLDYFTMCDALFSLTDVQEPSEMFPGNECSEGWRVPVWGLQGSSLQISASNKWFSRERSRPFWLTHEHEKLTSCQSKDREVLTFWLRWTRGQWFCFLFCVKQYVPSVHWCCESFLRSVVCCEKRKRLPYWQPHRCYCDQRWHKSSVHMVGGKNEVDTITQKNLMEHFWSNFNTRLIVFSWTHYCQDVNCFGVFFFLFKT